MTPIWKHIIAAICALLVIAYMVFGLWMSRHTVPEKQCQSLQVRILDGQERQYVSTGEIAQMISNHGLSPVGKKSSRIALQPIEDLLLTHSMVRTGECYKTVEGNVCIVLTQRVPIIRVATGAETYFVDSDRKRMQVRESVKTPVLLATGAISHQMATHELSDFAVWLERHPYWQARIARVDVVTPQLIRLIQRNGEPQIILGNWSGYERKLKKLRHWYEGTKELNMATYRQVDLRFQGQVIGIKN